MQLASSRHILCECVCICVSINCFHFENLHSIRSLGALKRHWLQSADSSNEKWQIPKHFILFYISIDRILNGKTKFISTNGQPDQNILGHCGNFFWQSILRAHTHNRIDWNISFLLQVGFVFALGTNGMVQHAYSTIEKFWRSGSSIQFF